METAFKRGQWYPSLAVLTLLPRDCTTPARALREHRDLFIHAAKSDRRSRAIRLFVACRREGGAEEESGQRNQEQSSAEEIASAHSHVGLCRCLHGPRDRSGRVCSDRKADSESSCCNAFAWRGCIGNRDTAGKHRLYCTRLGVQGEQSHNAAGRIRTCLAVQRSTYDPD